MRIAAAVTLSPEQPEVLERMARARSMPARIVERARIVLLAADGMQDKHIAGQLNITPEKAARWRNRFLDGGFAALEKDAPRPGKPRTITRAKIQQVVADDAAQKPATPPTGARAPWRRQRASVKRACAGSGIRMA